MRARTRASAHGPRVAYMVLTVMVFNAWITAGALHRLACAPRPAGPAIKLHSALAVMVAVLQSGPGPPA